MISQGRLIANVFAAELLLHGAIFALGHVQPAAKLGGCTTSITSMHFQASSGTKASYVWYRSREREPAGQENEKLTCLLT